MGRHLRPVIQKTASNQCIILLFTLNPTDKLRIHKSIKKNQPGRNQPTRKIHLNGMEIFNNINQNYF